MAAKKSKGKKEELVALYLKLDSLKDLARNAASERSFILAVKTKDGYSLMCEGERIGDGKIMYLFETKKIGRYLIYSSDEELGERADILDDVTEGPDHYKSQRTPIIEILKDPYSPMDKKDLKDVGIVEAKDMDSLMRAVVSEMGEDEMPKVVSFKSGKERIVGTLTLLKEHNKLFLYSKSPKIEPFSNITYDYNSDRVEASQSFSGMSKVHIRVINLEEKPPFFNV